MSPMTSNIRIIDLALKDLRQITRDRKSFIFLLIMPVAFTLLFGFAFGGNSTGDDRLPVGLLDQDNSEISQELAGFLQNSEVLRIVETEPDPAILDQQVADEELAAAIIIPQGFQASLYSSDPVQPVTIIGGGQSGFTIETEVQSLASRMANAIQAAKTSAEVAEEQGLIAGEEQQRTYIDQAYRQTMTEWESPPVTLHENQTSATSDAAEQEEGSNNAFTHSSPGMMAQFAIAGLIGAAGILVVEKKTQSVHRLLTTNMSKWQILIGHFLAMFIMIFLQLITLILFGQLFLDLSYFSQPLATLLLTIGTTLFTAGLGMLIGAVASSEEQVIVLSLVPMFLLAGLGGAWVPLEFTPQSFQTIAFLTPVAWVVDGYKDILIRGQGLEAVGTAVLVLLAYAAILFAIASWRFRVD